MSYHYGDSSAAGAIGNLGGLVAGGKFNPLNDPRFTIRGGSSPYSQPVLPNDKSREELDKEMFIVPTPGNGTPMAGTSNLPNALYSIGPNPMMGNVAGMQSYLALQNQINNPYGQTIPNIPGFS